MTHQTMRFCRLSAEEIDAGAQVVFDAFNGYSEKSGMARIPDVKIVSDRLREYAEDTGIPGLLYGAFEEDVLVGFMLIRKLGIDEEAWEISMLSVPPARQGQGIGRRLVEYALQEILTLKGVLAVCAVTEGNDAALHLLAKQGFESEASGIPVGGDMSIWMLRKDMTNRMAARAAAAEAADDAAREAAELAGERRRPVVLDTAGNENAAKPENA